MPRRDKKRVEGRATHAILHRNRAFAPPGLPRLLVPYRAGARPGLDPVEGAEVIARAPGPGVDPPGQSGCGMRCMGAWLARGTREGCRSARLCCDQGEGWVSERVEPRVIMGVESFRPRLTITRRRWSSTRSVRGSRTDLRRSPRPLDPRAPSRVPTSSTFLRGESRSHTASQGVRARPSPAGCRTTERAARTRRLHLRPPSGARPSLVLRGIA